jgi:hypothetical protein
MTVALYRPTDDNYWDRDDARAERDRTFINVQIVDSALNIVTASKLSFDLLMKCTMRMQQH